PPVQKRVTSPAQLSPEKDESIARGPVGRSAPGSGVRFDDGALSESAGAPAMRRNRLESDESCGFLLGVQPMMRKASDLGSGFVVNSLLEVQAYWIRRSQH